MTANPTTGQTPEGSLVIELEAGYEPILNQAIANQLKEALRNLNNVLRAMGVERMAEIELVVPVKALFDQPVRRATLTLRLKKAEADKR